MESWVTNWSNTRQSEILLNDIQEKSILKEFIELEELLLLDEMIKEYPETCLQNLRIGIYKETIQLIKTHNEDHMNTILHFSTNIICFVILGGYSILGNQELIILNSWVQEFIWREERKAWFLKNFEREMEDPEDKEILENRIKRLSKGEVGHEVDAEALKGLKLVKLHRGFLLCEFLVHYGVSDESGKWHEGAMITLMDVIASWTALSFSRSLASIRQITVHLSTSFFSKPNLLEVLEVEGKVMGKNGRMTYVRVELRKKQDGQMVASTSMWMSPHQFTKHFLSSKL